MKSKIYFLLTHLFISLLSWARMASHYFNYYKKFCLLRAISCSYLPDKEKNELWEEVKKTQLFKD